VVDRRWRIEKSISTVREKRIRNALGGVVGFFIPSGDAESLTHTHNTDIDELTAEIERLRPNAAIGKAIRELPPQVGIQRMKDTPGNQILWWITLDSIYLDCYHTIEEALIAIAELVASMEKEK